MLSLNSDDLHHAILIVGDIGAAQSSLEEFLEEEMKIDLAGNPDLMRVKEERLGIETARKLRSAQQKKGFTTGARTIFVAAFDQITPPAQNALLKSLEEPTEKTHFFLITPDKSQLLPTLLSRVSVLNFDNVEAKESLAHPSPDKFIHANTPDRIEMLSDVVDGKKNAQARAFVNALEKNVYESQQVDYHGLAQIQEIKKYLGNTGCSLKLLLHHIALFLPQPQKGER